MKLETNELVGVSSGQRFPIRDGIPSFISDIDRATLPPRNRFYRWFYDHAAFAYDFTIQLGSRISVGTEETVRRELSGLLKIKPGDKVLESAAGTGANLLHLPAHAQYYCLDISLNMLRRAARSFSRWGRAAHLFHADAQYLPFKDETFDVVFQMGGLQFVADPFNAAREMARVAKAEATIVIFDEISGAERMFRRLPAHAPYAIGRESTLDALHRLVPPGYQTLRAEVLPSGEFYALSFTNQA